MRKGGVQLLEFLEVVEHRLHDRVHLLGGHFRRAHEGGEHAEGVGRLRVVGIEARGDRDLGIVRPLLHQAVDGRPGQRHQLGAAARGRVLDVGGGVAHRVEEAVDLAVAQCRAVLVGLQLGGEREVGELPLHLGEDLLHRGARARARVADVELLALEVGEGLDVGLLARDDGEGLGVQRHDGAQVSEGARVLELLRPGDRVVHHVGLGDAEVELAGLDRVDVEHRPAGGFHGAADAVLGAVLVHEAADGAAGCVVDAGDAAGADGDVFLLGCGVRCQEGGGNGCGSGEGDERAFHCWGSSWWVGGGAIPTPRA